MKETNIVLIDADSLCYLGSKEDTLSQILEKVDYKINSIIEKTKADFYKLFVSKGIYFRHKLKTITEGSGTYKANRTYTSQNFNKAIKEYLIVQYKADYCKGVEADDVIAYWMNKTNWTDVYIDELNPIYNHMGDKVNLILASVDKDLLQSISGRHLNYNKKVGAEEWDMVWIDTKKEAADDFIWEQMIIGDTADGIKGIPGKGKAYYSKLFQDEDTIEDKHEYILNEYVQYYGISQGIYEFQKNYRLLHLLDCKEDWEREVGYTPELPLFLKAEKQEEEIPNKF